MKTIKQQIVSALLIGLATSSFSLKAQSVQLTGSDPEASSVRVGSYVNAEKNLVVLLSSKDSKRLSITLKDPKQNIIYHADLKGSSTTYQQKFNFAEAPSGQYELEVSDGSQTVVQKVKVIDVPAVEAQRFITYDTRALFKP